MDSEDGQIFIKRLSGFVRSHEKALANAIQLQQRKAPLRRGSDIPGSPRTPIATSSRDVSTSSGLSSTFSIPSLPFTSGSMKPAKLSLTPHHLYYLLTRFEELNIQVGPMGVRLENIHAQESPSNYVSFLNSSARRNRSSDSLSMHSVSSVRSVMTGMSSMWSNFGFGGSIESRNAKAKAALDADLKYLYSAFTKIPCLRLAPDRKARLVEGFEEFPFDTAVPLIAFKNVSSLEICDIDIRQFFGWDRMAEQLRSLVVKRAGIEDPVELLISIVLDDVDKRRKRSSKAQSSPIISYSPSTPAHSTTNVNGTVSGPPSPLTPSTQLAGAHAQSAPAHYHPMSRGHSESSRSSSNNRPRSSSPSRGNSTAASRAQSHRMRRSGSSSSHSSQASTILPPPNPIALPPSKWRLLRHLSLSDNSLPHISASALVPLAGSLTSLDLSNNLFTAIPESLSILTNLRALNLSGNMIDSLHSLTRTPLPAITSLNLRGNRLSSLAGIERALTLERLDLRQNRLTDPTELARLTGAPNFTAVWVADNPFTKTHVTTYRIAIFNLFRSTPGYTDDIQLDSQGPGMMEKRNLVDRVGEAASVPIIKAPRQQPVTVHQVAPLEAKKKDRQSAEEEKKSTNNGTAEVARAKRKGGRRRVVELSRDDCVSPTPDNGSVRTVTRTQTMRPEPVPQMKLKQQIHEFDHNPAEEASSGAESSPPPSLPNENVDWSVRGDEYRRKVEALKNEVGSGWLSVLSEEGLSLASTRKGGPSSPVALSVSPRS
ncbi:Similar to Uncharacterized leucine-rich repeat-containing protein C926.06c; acc. no. Q9UUG2 [Pyronema omphalodes CBS 100304]|uniref:Similar to Uncharacterized leucine-rich repeat-containing protein C926.06c acc. no. Q9UUG2 n=1 Tax=Pyronema omphalodes (strain CBS 100304) TaxID=1076935 RepID=U4L8W0_PYROM|nr:Similar to Uncharacterized leucine-rich repeat-containing protein C926.06c; acc. no. Q9UUG2 [Pyronema omphalodes CBS 100304]